MTGRPLSGRLGGRRFAQSWLVEAMLSLLLLSAVNFYLFSGDIGYTKASPHPYWLVVVLVAVRYGFGGGFWAGVLAAIFFVGFRMLRAAPAPLDFADLGLWVQPLLFLSAGIVLGEIREQQKRRFEGVELEISERQRAYERLEKQYKALGKAKKEIDGHIISQEQTLYTLYEAAQALRSLDEKDICPAALDLLREYMHVNECSIYVLEDEVLKLKAAIREEGGVAPASLPRDAGMVGRALLHGEAVSLNKHLRTEIPKDGPVIVSPIHHPSNATALGIVAVDKMPFLKFTPESVKMVSMIADWCGASLINARVHKGAKSKLIVDEILQAYTSDYLKQRLLEEFLRARRYELPLSILVLRLPESTRAKGGEDMLIAFSLALKEQLRKIDLLFLSQREREFILLLPNTPIQGARVVSGNLRRQFEQLYQKQSGVAGRQSEIIIGASAFIEELKEPQALLRLALEDATRAAGA